MCEKRTVCHTLNSNTCSHVWMPLCIMSNKSCESSKGHSMKTHNMMIRNRIFVLYGIHNLWKACSVKKKSINVGVRGVCFMKMYIVAVCKYPNECKYAVFSNVLYNVYYKALPKYVNMIFLSLLCICRQKWLIPADSSNKKECIFNFNGTTGTDGQKFPLINKKNT